VLWQQIQNFGLRLSLWLADWLRSLFDISPSVPRSDGKTKNGPKTPKKKSQNKEKKPESKQGSKIKRLKEQIRFSRIGQIMVDDAVKDQIFQAAEQNSIDPIVFLAISIRESSCNPLAMRYEPDFPYIFDMGIFARKIGSSVATEEIGQKTSWGVAQIMGSVAREHGFRGWFPELCQVDVGARYGALHLKSMFARFKTTERAVAAYNAGSPRKSKTGKYINQPYVDDVVRIQQQIIAGSA